MDSIKATTSKLNIVSSNVRGLRNKNKCQALLNALIENEIHICLLQETYFTDNTNDLVGNLYDDKFTCISSYGTNHSRGVTILIKKMNDLKIVNHRCDNEGRLILLNLSILDELYTVVNIYAPNNEKQRTELFSKVEKWLSKYADSKENCFVAGDFNLTPNPILDRKNGNDNYMDKSRQRFNKLCKSFELCDLWRIKNPQKIEFTCRVQSRIDLMLCTNTLYKRLNNVNIAHPYVYSDHQLLIAKFNVIQHARGPGYWKLNCSILNDDVYVTEMKSMLRRLKSENKMKMSSQKLWEMCKIKIKEFTIMYCKKKNYVEKSEVKKIEKDLKEVEQRLHTNWSKNIEIQKKSLLNSLESHYLKKARAAQIRSRVQWIEEGEKNTQFFLNLEKYHQTHNTIKSLKVGDKQIVDQENIIQEVVRFYTGLYSSQNVSERLMSEYLQDTNVEYTLSESEKMTCEGLLTITECTETINKMKKNKSPGKDGLPVEFYLTFWEEIKYMVVNALNDAYQKGEMSSSQKRAIITLLYKKDDPELLKNWRPISLLNTDYKVAAFVIANRLQGVLSKVICKDQTGYVRGRFIGSNIRLIEDIFEYTEKNKLQGAALFCDYEKAFDTVEIPFVIQVLQKFNFGTGFQNWIKTFYCNVDACIKCNNWISSPLKVKRGIRQGCPISALLFILVVEIMATNIRANKNIKGIKLPGRVNTEAKISQLADDTTLFLRDSASVVTALEEIARFGKVAGLTLNVKKTVGIWLGTLKDCKVTIGGITWTSDMVKALGVYFGHDVKKKIQTNWEDKISQVEKCLKVWDKRNLTLIGRIMIVKMLAVSKFTFLSSVIECTESYVKAINKMLFSFIWNGKRDKVKRDTMIGGKLEGGLKMVDYRLKDKALKVTMLKRILEPGDERWKIIPLHYFNKTGQNSLLFNANRLPDECINGEMDMPIFYKQLLMSLNSCKHKAKSPPCTATSVRQQMIWGNEWITYKGKSLWYTRWIKSNIVYVNDLFDPEGNFVEQLIYDKIENKTNIIPEMYKLKNAIPATWKNILLQDPCKIHVKHPSVSEICFINRGHLLYLRDVTSAGNIYQILVDINKKPPCTKAYWNKVFHDKNITWTYVYSEKICNVKEQKIVAFNFKILNNILATPYKLYKWKLAENEICHLCFSTGDLDHMMLKCSYFKDYYVTVLRVFKLLGYANIKNDLYTLVCGYKAGTDVYKPVNLILHVIFFSVYKCWVKVKINRRYENPLKILHNELKIRCATNIYDKFAMFLKYTETLETIL